MKLFCLFFFPMFAFASFLEDKMVKDFDVRVLSKKELLDQNFMSKFTQDKRDKFFLSKDGGVVELQKLNVKKRETLLETFGEKRIHKAFIGFMAKEGFQEKIVWNILTAQKRETSCQPTQRGYQSKSRKYFSIDRKLNYIYEIHSSVGKKEGCLQEAQKTFLFLEQDGKCVQLQSFSQDCFGEKKAGLYPIGHPVGVLSVNKINILLLESEKNIIGLSFQNGSVSKVSNWDY